MSPRPLHLLRLLMRRSALVVATTLLAALALGLHTALQDITEEQNGALALAHTLARLQSLSSMDDGTAYATLQNIREGRHELRHLQLEVTGPMGQTLLSLGGTETSSDTTDPTFAQRAGTKVTETILGLHHRFFPLPTPALRVQSLSRPDGSRWTLTLHASPESERLEALSGLFNQIGMLFTMGVGLLLMLRINLRHALGPVATLLAGIGRLEKQDTQALRHLPPMPVLELEQIAGALRHLAESLEQGECSRRVLAHQLAELQEDERQRIASDLHDELGQHLTALRLDLSWLHRQLASAPASQAATVQPLLGITTGMTDHCRRLQNDLRSLLTRLRPFGHSTPSDGFAPPHIGLGALRELIRSLCDSWTSHDRDRTFRIDWQVRIQADDDIAPDPDELGLDRGVALTLFRLSQEALTNVARHASASHARLLIELRLHPVALQDPVHSRRADIEWICEDDGVGLPESNAPPGHTVVTHRGNGLAGMHERIWLLGGRWALARSPDLGGLQLSARLSEITVRTALSDPEQEPT